MITITLQGPLEEGLRQAARRQGRPPEDCVLAAVRAFVADCEEAAAQAARLGQGMRCVRDEDFHD